eukprot:830383-Prymnesium_polylepis.1
MPLPGARHRGRAVTAEACVLGACRLPLTLWTRDNPCLTYKARVTQTVPKQGRTHAHAPWPCSNCDAGPGGFRSAFAGRPGTRGHNHKPGRDGMRTVKRTVSQCVAGAWWPVACTLQS